MTALAWGAAVDGHTILVNDTLTSVHRVQMAVGQEGVIEHFGTIMAGQPDVQETGRLIALTSAPPRSLPRERAPIELVGDERLSFETHRASIVARKLCNRAAPRRPFAERHRRGRSDPGAAPSFLARRGAQGTVSRARKSPLTAVPRSVPVPVTLPRTQRA